MQHYTIPGFWEQQSIIIPLLVLYRQHNYVFKNSVIIDSAYGNFHHTIWDGGRAQQLSQIPIKATYNDIELFQNIYNNILNIPVRFIFTNQLLTQEHCKDDFCNFILETFSQYPNQITINSLILENYILNKYSNYSLISSITKQLSYNDIIQELKKEQYIQVCIPFQYNKDKNFFFNIIPFDLRYKCEILANTKCPITCIGSRFHTKADSAANLNKIQPVYNFPCAKKNTNLQGTAIISPKEIEEYVEHGYINYKLIERIFVEPLELINNLNQYLIKSEYQTVIKKYLLFYNQNWQQIDLNNFNFKQFDFDFFKNI